MLSHPFTVLALQQVLAEKYDGSKIENPSGRGNGVDCMEDKDCQCGFCDGNGDSFLTGKEPGMCIRANSGRLYLGEPCLLNSECNGNNECNGGHFRVSGRASPGDVLFDVV